ANFPEHERTAHSLAHPLAAMTSAVEVDIDRHQSLPPARDLDSRGQMSTIVPALDMSVSGDTLTTSFRPNINTRSLRLFRALQVRRAVIPLWRLLEKNSGGLLERDEYHRLMLRIYQTLVGRSLDGARETDLHRLQTEALASIEMDWKMDADARQSIDLVTFYSALFDLVGTWVGSHNVAAY
ncbi:hypothetical protein KIPB_012699, partial [Kipferlia bialata]